MAEKKKTRKKKSSLTLKKTRKTILIIEDDIDMQMLYKAILYNTYKLVIRGSVEKGEAYLKKNKVDLILLDIILPKIAGDSFFIKLKQTKKYQNIKVIIVTVISDIIKHIKNVDPDVICLTKPILREDLLNAIETELKR